jgi:hypothetical protein
MLDAFMQDQEPHALARIASAAALEETRFGSRGNPGPQEALTLIGKEMCKLATEERGRIGKLLNVATQKREEALEAKKKAFDEAALRAPRFRVDRPDLPAPERAAAVCTPSRASTYGCQKRRVGY